MFRIVPERNITLVFFFRGEIRRRSSSKAGRPDCAATVFTSDPIWLLTWLEEQKIGEVTSTFAQQSTDNAHWSLRQ